MSGQEAKQMLTAIVGSISRRIERNEALTKELCEQLQILSANHAGISAESQTADKERLLAFMQDWMGNLKRFIEKVDGLQKSLKSAEQEIQEMRVRVEQLSGAHGQGSIPSEAPVGVVTKETLTRLSPTEKTVLELLIHGPKAAPEIGRLVGKSREHTARMMKSLFEQGFVEREANRQPYQYRLNDKVGEVLAPPSQPEAIQREG